MTMTKHQLLTWTCLVARKASNWSHELAVLPNDQPLEADDTIRFIREVRGVLDDMQKQLTT